MWHTISQVPLNIHIQTCKICNMYLYMAYRHASDSTWKLLFTCLWLRDRTSKHGNHDCGIRHVLARSSVRGSKSPVGGVVKACEPVWGQGLFLSGGVLRVNIPINLSIKLMASARIKEETHTSKEGKAGLQTAPLHRHTPWCYLWLLLPFVVTSATS